VTQPDRWLFVSDVDDTLLGDDAALACLSEALQAASHKLTVVYNSSRPCVSLRSTLTNVPHILTPDYLVGAMGTEIQEGESGKPITGYTRRLSRGWRRDQINAIMEEMGFRAHSSEYQTAFKASYDVPDAALYAQVLHRLEAARIDAKVIYSGGKNLDIIPRLAGKRTAIEYLRQWLQISPERVVVAGDSGNDLEMFVSPYRGIVVANAAPELKKLRGDHIYHAQSAYAGGVLEGLRFWGVL
jgi:sucrose-6F-phosphate phosphohydrolase